VLPNKEQRLPKSTVSVLMNCQSGIPAQNQEIRIDVQQKLADLLDAAIAVSGATKGNLQLFNRSRGELKIVAQRGFDPLFIQQLECLRADGNTICCRAFRMGRRVAVADITTDPAYEPHRAVFDAAGFRAVQSTPILMDNGSVGGVFSTHHPEPYHLCSQTGTALDQISNRMAALLAD
jgi:GAF domain-containing protein